MSGRNDKMKLLKMRNDGQIGNTDRSSRSASNGNRNQLASSLSESLVQEQHENAIDFHLRLRKCTLIL